VINGAKLEDAGKITVKSNADQASADLGVKCKLVVALRKGHSIIGDISLCGWGHITILFFFN
jgi:hypothetical protein